MVAFYGRMLFEIALAKHLANAKSAFEVLIASARGELAPIHVCIRRSTLILLAAG